MSPSNSRDLTTTQVIGHTRKQSRLSNAQEEPRSHQSSGIVHQAHRRHDDAPKHHNRRNENRRLQALEQDVGEGFEAGVRDEEKRKSGVVLAAGHAEVVNEAVDFGVADVGPVEEGDEVEEGQPGDDLDVEAADEFLVLCCG